MEPVTPEGWRLCGRLNQSDIISEKRPLIPVVLDADVKVPPLLRSLSLCADQIPQLVDAIEGRVFKSELNRRQAPVETRTRMLASSMGHGMEASYSRLQSIL